MQLIEQINKNKLPQHIAIIMDGNGRWAKQKGNKRIFGHQNGVKAVRDTVEGAAELGIGYLTLYAFSTENWNRPRTEIDALMSLLIASINKETKNLMENNIRLLTIGDTNSLPKGVNEKLKECIESTSKNTGTSLILALSYSGKWEILDAVKKIGEQIEKGAIKSNEINESIFDTNLNTAKIPDPELLIRTSGEYRISNFLLWQIAYAELYFTDILWPDFRKENLFKAIIDYQKRERRFGKTSEQLN